MSTDYSTLQPGQEISNQAYDLDSSIVAKYLEATAGEFTLVGELDARQLVPPMAVAALSLRGIVNDLGIPGGTLHVGQELEFKNPVPVGSILECRASILQNSLRGKWRFIVVKMDVKDGDGLEVMAGKSTITVPA